MIKLHWLKLELGCVDPNLPGGVSVLQAGYFHLSQLWLYWPHDDSGVTDFVKNFFHEYAKILTLIGFAHQNLLPLKQILQGHMLGLVCK